MPKPNQTMLDKLVDAFKSGSQGTPFREMKIHGEFTDPMVKARANQQLAGNKLIKLDPSWRTPERVKYQKGLESLRRQKMKPIREEEIDARDRFKELQSEFDEAYGDAYERWQDEVNTTVPEDAPNLEFGFEPSDLDFPAPRADLRDYWPGYAKYYDVFEREADDLRGEIAAIDDRMDYARSPEYIQQLQTETPRYRRYQEAMQRRDINRRAGRVNAAIMNLARQGYSLPEIREILRRQGR